MSRTRAGFTLLEVVIALGIGALLVLGGRAVFEQLADTADRVTAFALASDRAANAERAVRALVDRTIAAENTSPFAGNAAVARFTSWCAVPAGWLERCTVTIAVAPSQSADTSSIAIRQAAVAASHPLAVVVRTSTGEDFPLRDHLTHAELHYLDDAAEGGRWVSSWSTGVTTPLAIGILTDRDTLLLRIGERR